MVLYDWTTRTRRSRVASDAKALAAAAYRHPITKKFAAVLYVEPVLETMRKPSHNRRWPTPRLSDSLVPGQGTPTCAGHRPRSV